MDVTKQSKIMISFTTADTEVSSIKKCMMENYVKTLNEIKNPSDKNDPKEKATKKNDLKALYMNSTKDLLENVNQMLSDRICLFDHEAAKNNTSKFLKFLGSKSIISPEVILGNLSSYFKNQNIQAITIDTALRNVKKENRLFRNIRKLLSFDKKVKNDRNYDMYKKITENSNCRGGI